MTKTIKFFDDEKNHFNIIKYLLFKFKKNQFINIFYIITLNLVSPKIQLN